LRTWRTVVLNIEDIEELRSELQREALRDVLLLHKREINVVEQHAAESTSSGGAELVHGI